MLLTNDSSPHCSPHLHQEEGRQKKKAKYTDSKETCSTVVVDSISISEALGFVSSTREKINK